MLCACHSHGKVPFVCPFQLFQKAIFCTLRQECKVVFRVGRVLVRKLVLRGYKVTVLARNREEVAQSLPSSVRIVEGDITDVQACRTAIAYADKVQ